MFLSLGDIFATMLASLKTWSVQNIFLATYLYIHGLTKEGRPLINILERFYFTRYHNLSSSSATSYTKTFGKTFTRFVA